MKHPKWSEGWLSLQPTSKLPELLELVKGNMMLTGETQYRRSYWRWSRIAGRIENEIEGRGTMKAALYVALAPNGQPYHDTLVCSYHLAEFIKEFNSDLAEGDTPLVQSDFVSAITPSDLVTPAGIAVEAKKHGCLYCSMKPGLQREF